MKFEEAWESMKKRGYDYGPDALENVRLGWTMAVEQCAAVVGANAKAARICNLDQTAEALEQAAAHIRSLKKGE